MAEGEFDIYAYSALIKRENSSGLGIHTRFCRNSVSGRFGKILAELAYLDPPINKAIVVSDAHGTDRHLLRTQLHAQIKNTNFPFPVEIVVVVQALEAILLCDPRAIESVCQTRGKPIQIPGLVRTPEALPNPKRELVMHLIRGGLQYTRVVAAEIASVLFLTLRYNV